MAKYKRELTVEEKLWISNMSRNSPSTAMNLAKTLREESFHISGRLVFFTPNVNENQLRKKGKPIRKKRKLKRLKIPIIKGRIRGLEKLNK